MAGTGLLAVLAGLSAQAHGLAGPDLGGALGLSADEASWITTAGSAASPLHEAAYPCVWRGLSDGAECRQPDRRREGAPGQGKGRLEAKPLRINKP